MELAIIGLLINMVGAISSAFGYVIQKKVHINLEGSDKHFLATRMWWLGMFLVLLSQPLYLFAAVMVKISVMGVLNPFNILVNIIIARIILDEKVKFWEYIGITLFIPGTIMTLMFSCIENHRYSREQMNIFLYSGRTISYLLINFFALVILMTISNFILKANPGGSAEEYSEQIDDDYEFFQQQRLDSIQDYSESKLTAGSNRNLNKITPR